MYGGKSLLADGDAKLTTGPFTSGNGYIHIYANVTQFHSDSQTTTFNETRLGINANGELSDCGDCRSTQQFGFEVCQGPDRNGYNGLYAGDVSARGEADE